MSFASSSLSFVQRNAMTIDVQRLAQLAEACDVDDMIDVFSDIPLTVDFIRLFSRTLRSVLAPDSNNFKQCNSDGCSWDGIFAILFTCLFRYSSPSACWPRICKTLILRDAQPFSAKGGKNIWNGVVAVLMDRYFKIFDCIYENRFLDVATFLRQRHDPMLKNNSRLGFDTTFLRVVSIVPAQWTILHHAAHWSSKEMLIELIECGAEVGVLDADRRHPLHIAAISLNFDALDYLVDQHGRSFTQDIDIYDKTPLDLLLQSVSLSDWAKRVSPMRLLSSVVRLLSAKSSLWIVPGASYAENGSMMTSARITGDSIYSNKLYAILHSIRGRDRLVAAPIVELAWSCPSVTWNIPIVMHCILLSVRQRRFHLLECLLEHFSEFLFSSFQLSELADQSGAQVESFFLQYCLYVAVHSKASLRIVSLLTHYSFEQFSSRGLKQIVDSVPLTEAILVSVMRCTSFFQNPSRRPSTGTISILSHSQSIQSFNSNLRAEESDAYSPSESPSLVLDEILNMFGPSAIQLPTYPSYRGILGVDGTVMALIDDFPSLWSPFANSEEIENLLRNFTPLSMACLLGCTATLDILLQHIPTPLKLFLPSSVAHSLRLLVPHGEGIEGLGGVEGLGWNPIVCCILSSSPVCLMQIRNHMGPEIFSDACWSSDERGLTPIIAMLHLVKAHSLHRKRVEDRARPVPFSCSLGGARRSHEDVTQILSILLDAHPSTLEDHLPQHLSPLQVSDRESEPSVWEARYDALVARYDLVERRLGDLIAQSTAAQSNNNSDSDEEDATVCQTLRVQWDERAALPSPGSASSQRLRLGQPSFFPASLNASVLREISQSKSHQDAQRLIQQSRAMWGRLEAAMGTPRGMHTLYYRMRSFLRTVYPDRHLGLIAECLVLVLSDEPMEHRGLPLETEDHPFEGESDQDDLRLSLSPGSPEQRSSKDPSRRPSTAPSTLLLCWKELVMRAGITVGPESSPSTCSIEHFESLCQDLLSVSNPLKSRYGSGYNYTEIDEGRGISLERGGSILSETRWREVKASYGAMRKRWLPSKGHHPHKEIVDLLTLYIRTVVQDGEVLYGSQISLGELGLSCPTFTLKESIEAADLIECREQLDEVLPHLHYMRSADANGLRDGCPLLSTLLSASNPPSSLVQLCAAHRAVTAETVASGIVAARGLGRTADSARGNCTRDSASVMQSCVQALALACSSSVQAIGDGDGKPEIMYSSVTLHRTLLSLTALGYWDAALVMMKNFAAVAEKEREKGTVPDSPFRCCTISTGNSLDAALHTHTSSLSPVRATSYTPGRVGPVPFYPRRFPLDEDDPWDRVNPAEMYPLSPLHYAAASGQLSFLQKALELFPCEKIPRRLILDIISLALKHGAARKRRNKILNILVSSLVSRLEVVPGSPSAVWGHPVPEGADPLYQAAWNALKAKQPLTSLQSLSTREEDKDGQARGVGLDLGLGEVSPQHDGPLRGLCIRSTTHAPRINTPPNHPSRSHMPQPLSSPALLRREWTSIPVPGDTIETSVVMMDGTAIPLNVFTSDIDNLYKALPMPQMALGISCTGHTLLQEAAQLSDPSLLASLLESGEAATDTEGRRGSHSNGSDEMLSLVSEIGTGFMMNSLGETALCLALKRGHLDLANSMIRRALGSYKNNLLPVFLDAADFPRSASPPKADGVQRQGQGGTALIDRLYLEDTARSTTDSVKSLFLTSAAYRVEQAEEEHRAVSREQLSFPPMAASVNVLIKVFARLEVLQREISSCDFKHFTRLSYSPPGSVLDSLIRAKMVLTLLGIPFSKMGVAFEVPPPASPSDRKEPFVRNCLNPSNLNPQGVLGLLSHHVTGQLRDLLVKWCRFRVEESEFLDARGAGESMSNYSDSASLTEVLLLFHRLDVTLVDVGEKGGYFPPRLDSASLREGHMHSESAGPAHLQYPSFAQKSSSRSRAQRQQVRVRGKGRERRSRSSEAFSRDASRSSDSSRSSVKSLPDQLIVETRVRYRGGSHRSPTNPSPYTYQPALSSPSHSAFVPPSPLKTSFATIIPSFRDIPQDEFVRTREMTPLKVSFAASVPSVREANHQDDHARNKDMAAFTECWARDPVSVKDALRLSYLILDFARLLVVARGMVLMTTEYGFSRPDWAPTNGPRTGSGSGSGQLEAYKLSVVHPLEMWQREVRAAKELKEKMRDAYSMVSDTADGALVSGPVVVAAGATGAVAVSGKNSSWLSDGLHSRLRLLDQLTGEDLLQYFRISKENNPQYSASRETLVRCIVLLLQSTGNQTLAEAASRLLRSSRIPLSSRGPTSRNMHGSPQQQSPLPSRWHSHTDSKDDGDWDPTRSRQTAVDSEDCHRIADALRALRVGDICPPRAVAPQERRSDRSPSSAPKRPSTATGEGKGKGKGSTGSEEYMIRLESICEEFLGPFDAPFPSASLHKTNTSPPMSPYKQNSPQYSAGAADKKAGKDNRNGTANGNGNVQIKNGLEKANRTAAVLTDFIRCIRGIYRQRAVYRLDVSNWLAEIKSNFNPLCALLSSCPLDPGGKETPRDLQRSPRAECCRHLLSLGVSGACPERTGRVPIAAAALRGDVTGNYFLREMLLQTTRVRASSVDTSISGERPNLNGTLGQSERKFSSAWTEDLEFLIWHVLMECPPCDTSPSPFPARQPVSPILGPGDLTRRASATFTLEEDCVISKSFSKALTTFKSKKTAALHRSLQTEKRRRRRGHEATLQLLLDHGFPVRRPPGVALRCTDLAALKMIPRGMLMAIAGAEAELKVQDPREKIHPKVPVHAGSGTLTPPRTSMSSVAKLFGAPDQTPYQAPSPSVYGYDHPTSPQYGSNPMHSPEGVTHAPTHFKAVHFILLAMGLPPNNVLDVASDDDKEDCVGDYAFPFLAALLDETFGRLTVSGAINVDLMLTLDDLQRDIGAHSSFMALHLSSETPEDSPSPPRSPRIRTRTRSTIHDRAASAKAIIAGSLRSFFPTAQSRLKRVRDISTPCPFWRGAHRSINTLSDVKSAVDARGQRSSPNSCKSHSGFLEDSTEGEYKEEVLVTCSWNVVHLAVRAGRLDVLRYLLNMPQLPSDGTIEEDEKHVYLGGSLQLMRGRRVPVDKPSLSICACFYDQPACLDTMRSYDGPPNKISSHLSQDTAVKPAETPSKRLVASMSRRNSLSVPTPEFKILADFYFEPLGCAFSLLGMSAYSGGLRCFHYLLGLSTASDGSQEVRVREDINVAWAIAVECLCHGYLSEGDLLALMQYVIKQLQSAELSVWREMKRESERKNSLMTLFDVSSIVPYRESVSLLVNALRPLSSLEVGQAKLKRRGSSHSSYSGSPRRESQDYDLSADLDDPLDSTVDDEASAPTPLPFEESVFQLCCRRGYSSLVQVLLQYGADMRARDGQGFTPWRLSVCGGHSKVTALLGGSLPKTGEVHSAARTIGAAFKRYVRRRTAYLGSSRSVKHVLENQEISGQTTRDGLDTD